MQGRGVLRKEFLSFFALLATQFSLRRRQNKRRRGRCTSINFTALTALLIRLFKFNIFDVVF